MPHLPRPQKGAVHHRCGTLADSEALAPALPTSGVVEGNFQTSQPESLGMGVVGLPLRVKKGRLPRGWSWDKTVVRTACLFVVVGRSTKVPCMSLWPCTLFFLLGSSHCRVHLSTFCCPVNVLALQVSPKFPLFPIIPQHSPVHNPQRLHKPHRTSACWQGMQCVRVRARVVLGCA